MPSLESRRRNFSIRYSDAVRCLSRDESEVNVRTPESDPRNKSPLFPTHRSNSLDLDPKSKDNFESLIAQFRLVQSFKIKEQQIFLFSGKFVIIIVIDVVFSLFFWIG